MAFRRTIPLVLAMAMSFPAIGHGMSMRGAVEQGVLTNPRVEAAQASRRATDYVLKQAQGRFLPEISLNADIGKQLIDRPQGLGPDVNDIWRKRRQVTLSVRQTLFDGFDRANDYYRSEARITAASHKVLAQSEAVGLDVVEAYIDVVRHRDLLRLARENVDRHVRLLSIIRERFDGGRAPIGDVEQTVERLEAAKALVAQINIALETAAAKFKGAVGVAPGSLERLTYAKNVPPTVEDVIATALQRNPRVQAAASEIDIAGFDIKQFKASLYPQLALEGSATRGQDLEGTPGRNDELKAMLTLTWKVFEGGIRRNRISELSERQAITIAEHRILLRELYQQIEIAWARLVTGRQQVAAIERQVQQNRKVLATYLDEYNANRHSLLDVLDAENSLFGSQFELSNVKALHYFASYQLLAHMGMLLPEFGIAAPAGADYYSAGFPERGLYDGYSTVNIPPLRSE